MVPGGRREREGKERERRRKRERVIGPQVTIKGRVYVNWCITNAGTNLEERRKAKKEEDKGR